MSKCCSKHVEAWNKTYYKTEFFASSWLITKINIEAEVASGHLDCLTLEDGTGVGCPETMEAYYRSTLCNIAETLAEASNHPTAGLIHTDGFVGLRYVPGIV